MDSISSMESYA